MVKVRVLGSNGWYATEQSSAMCILLETDQCYVVLDAGEGIYKLDKYILEEKPIYLFISHFHLDHVFGLHIFPKFKFKQGVTIFGQPGTKDILNTLANHPFSVSLAELKMPVKIRELEVGKHAAPSAPFSLETAYLKHADPTFGYRLRLGETVITYALDTGYCRNLVQLAKEADLLITECALLPGEKTSPAWPHLSPEAAAEAAVKARAKKLLLTHFSPAKYLNEQDRQRAVAAANKIFSNTFAATDGDEFTV